MKIKTPPVHRFSVHVGRNVYFLINFCDIYLNRYSGVEFTCIYSAYILLFGFQILPWICNEIQIRVKIT